MSLEQTLESLEQKANGSRRAMIRSAGVLVLLNIMGFIFNMMHGFAMYEWLPPLWSFLTCVAWAVFVVLTVRHWTTHRPALERGRIDMQIEMFAELQRQISVLTEQLKLQRH